MDAAAHVPGRGAAVSEARGWWAVGVLTLLCMISYLDRQIISLLVGPIRADLGVSDFQIGLLQGLAFALFYAVFGLPMGWAVDHYSRRHVIFVGVTIWSIAASSAAFAQRFVYLLLARFGVGTGEAALSPATYSLLSDLFPRHRLALALSVYGAGAVLGSAGAMALGGTIIDRVPEGGVTLPLLGTFSNWQFVFLLSGLPGLLLGWLVYTIPAAPRRHAAPATSSDAKGLLHLLSGRRRFYGGHIMGFSFNALASYGLVLWTPAYLIRTFGMSPGEVGLAVAAVQIPSGLVGAVAAGYLIDRWYAKGGHDAHIRFYVFAGLLQVVLVGLAVMMPTPGLFFVFAGASNVFSPFTGPAAAALQITTPAEYRGRVSAIFLFVMYMIGLGCGPAVVAAFTDFFFANDAMVGWSMALTYAIFLPLSAVFLGMACKPMRAAVDQQNDGLREVL